MRGNTALTAFTANILRRALSIQLEGNFTNVELFSLREVTGDFFVSGSPSMDCSWFEENLPGKVVKGKFTCIGNHTKPLTPRVPSTPTDVSQLISPLATATEVPDGRGGPSTAAKAGIGTGVTAVGLALIGMGLWIFRLQRRRSGFPNLSRSRLPMWGRSDVGGVSLARKRRGQRWSSSVEMQALRFAGELPARVFAAELAQTDKPVPELPTVSILERVKLGSTSRRHERTFELPG